MKTRYKPIALAALACVLAAPAAVFAGRAMPDTQTAGTLLSNRIRKELVTLPYYSVFDNLAFKLDGSTVTLYGQVLRPAVRVDAERRIAKIESVSKVVNKIEVLPPSAFDDSIRFRTYRAIFHTGSLYRYSLGANPSIHIIVNRGHVTLEGVVADKADSQMAYVAAMGVPGSFSVTNNLRVERKA